jgi:hypothetical protein
MDNENYFKDLSYNMTNKKELIFFAKLALVIIYDDIINNKTRINNLKDDIKNYNDE